MNLVAHAHAQRQKAPTLQLPLPKRWSESSTLAASCVDLVSAQVHQGDVDMPHAMLLNAITHRPATTQLLYVIPHRTATTRGWMSVRTRRGLIAITCAVTAAPKDTRLQGTALLRRSWLQLNLQLWPPPPPLIVFQLQVIMIVLPKRGVASEPERTVTIDSVKRTTTVRELKLMIKNKTGIHAGHFRLCTRRRVQATLHYQTRNG